MTITASPPPLIVDHAEPPSGTWDREASHFPEPLTPFTKALLRTEEWGRQITAEIGSLIDTTRFIEVRGWVYTRVVPIGDRPGAPPPPSWMVPLLFRVVPQIRRRMRAAKAAQNTDWAGRQIESWYQIWRDELSTRLAALRAMELEGLDDRALDEHLLSTIALSHHSLQVHFRLHAAIALELRAFTRCCSNLLGWDDERSLAMLTGTSTTSTQAGRALSDLARTAQRSPRLVELIGRAPVDQVLAADGEFAAAFAAYLDRYCFRALTYDLSDPTLAERPELVLNLVRDQLHGADRPAPGDGTPLIARAQTLLAAAPGADRPRFDEALERGRRAYPVREDNVYLTVSAPFALVRMSAQEIGRRLADRGRLAHRDDVFLLEVDEARSALLDGTDPREIVDRHREQRLHTLANPARTASDPHRQCRRGVAYPHRLAGRPRTPCGSWRCSFPGRAHRPAARW